MTNDMVRKEMFKDMVDITEERHGRRLLLAGFRAFIFSRNEMLRKRKVAAKFRFQKVVGRCFYPWTEWTYASSVGLDRRRLSFFVFFVYFLTSSSSSS